MTYSYQHITRGKTECATSCSSVAPVQLLLPVPSARHCTSTEPSTRLSAKCTTTTRCAIKSDLPRDLSLKALRNIQEMCGMQECHILWDNVAEAHPHVIRMSKCRL